MITAIAVDSVIAVNAGPPIHWTLRRFPATREPDSGSVQGVPDLGKPSSYLALAAGVPVYSSDERKVGRVEHVLSNPEIDIFDGIVLDTSVLPGGHRFVDAPQVEEIYEGGVVLKLDAAAAESLPKPSASPGALEVGPDDMAPEDIDDKLRRAWDVISGKG